MNSLIASVLWDEARFGLPLDLERFMIVAVSDFNMGAMENKGLNIFNTKYVLASPATATDNDYLGIESVVGHEYFHNWTGNRVTCRDWFQLSLKEGLTVFRDQEFSMDMARQRRARAPSSASPTCKRAARTPVPRGRRRDGAPGAARPATSRSTISTPPTIYEKGAEVVRMMHTLVGREGFTRGMALYFERHDGQAVTCDDFAQAIADANPGAPLATRLDAVQALVLAGRHAACHRTRPLRRAEPHLHPRLRAARHAHAGPAGPAALRDPDGARADRPRRPRHAAAARGRGGDLRDRARAGARRSQELLHLRQHRERRRCPRCCAASRRR